MTDPSRLSELLERAVPDPPPLAGLATRAETDARRARTRRRGAVGAVALVVVAVVGSLVVESRTPAPVADDVVPTPAGADGVPCRDDARTRGRADAEPVSVRFCEPVSALTRPVPTPALVPDLALTTDVASTVAALRAAERVPPAVDCFNGRNAYSIQIGYGDGSTEDLSTAPCGDDFTILLEAIGRQAAPSAVPLADPVSCQDHGPLDRSGDAAFPSYRPLLTLPAVEAVRCTTFQADARARSEVDDPEELRAALLSTLTDTHVDCSPTGPRTTWVLRLADGTVHTATLDSATPCGTVAFDQEYVGGAGPTLRALAGG